MHVHYLDPYRPGSSLVHHLDARVKFLLALAFIFTAALLPARAWPAYVLLSSLVLSVGILSELGLGYIQKRASLALPFVLAALPVMFTLEGPALFALPLGDWNLTISQTGAERLASIALKSWLSVQVAIVLAASTPFPDLLLAMRAVKVPRLLVAVFALMWRYLFVLADETLRLLRARAARSGRSEQPGLKSGGTLSWRAQVTGGMAGSLFLRAFERSDRIYMAMLSRGYDGEVRSVPLPELRGSQWWVFWAILALLAFLLGLAYLFWS